MTTERNAQGVDGLAEVMGLLDRAFDMPLRWSENGNIVPLVYTQDCEIAAVYTDREDNACPDTAAAIIAAVNYLRSHGEAMQARAKAAQVLVSFAEGRIHHRNMGDCPDEIEGHESRDPKCEVCAALAKFPEPRP